uniref:Uncharacterized protein n=1 Tax=Rhipicephalus zambeziensis TaxID=60191 RepID=A0A224Y5U9_9ACAR
MYIFTDPEAKSVTGEVGPEGGCGDRTPRRAYCAAHKIDSLLPGHYLTVPPSSLQSRFGVSRLSSRFRLNHLRAQGGQGGQGGSFLNHFREGPQVFFNFTTSGMSHHSF